MNYPPVPYLCPGFRNGTAQGRVRRLYLTSLMAMNECLGRSNLPKVGWTRAKNVDVIHSFQRIMLNRTPWVVDMLDHVTGFGSTRDLRPLFHPRFRRILSQCLASPHCKKILPMSGYIRDSLYQFLDTDGFAHKIERVSACHHPVPTLEMKPSQTVRLLFIGNRFYAKGGPATLRAFRELRARYPVELAFVCFDVPPSVVEEYQGVPGLRFLPEPGRIKKPFQQFLPVPHAVSRSEIERLYAEADIFLLPDLMDSLFVFLEAMAFGLPVVTTDCPQGNEFVEDGVTGFLVKCPMFTYWDGFMTRWRTASEYLNILKQSEFPELVKELVEKLSILIEDGGLRERMGAEAKRRIDHGPFSIEERNRKLRRIYQEAVES